MHDDLDEDSGRRERQGCGGGFSVRQANVGFDHATHAQVERALLPDFTNPALGPSARVAVELDLASGKTLVAQLQAATAAAELSGVAE